MISTESCQKAAMGKAVLPTFSHAKIVIIENLRQKFLKPL